MPAESFLHRALARKFAGKIRAGKTVPHPFPVGVGRDRAERVLFRDAPYPRAGAGAAGHLRTDLAGDATNTNLHGVPSGRPPLSLMISSPSLQGAGGSGISSPGSLPQNLLWHEILHRRALDHLSQGVIA